LSKSVWEETRELKFCMNMVYTPKKYIFLDGKFTIMPIFSILEKYFSIKDFFSVGQNFVFFHFGKILLHNGKILFHNGKILFPNGKILFHNGTILFHNIHIGVQDSGLNQNPLLRN
jgi:hypothetical protein